MLGGEILNAWRKGKRSAQARGWKPTGPRRRLGERLGLRQPSQRARTTSAVNVQPTSYHSGGEVGSKFFHLIR